MKQVASSSQGISLSLKDISISRKLLLIVLFAAIGMGIIAGTGLYHLRASLVAKNQVTIKSGVDTAVSLINHFANRVKNEGVDEKNAQAQALKAMTDLRYGENFYFWVQTDKNIMLAHPFRTEFIGTDINDKKDADGNFIYQKILEIVNSPAGGGYHYYNWRLTADAPSLPKFSYCLAYKPWKWVVCSGVDDTIRQDLISEAITLGGVTAVVFAIILWLMLVINRNITRPLGSVTQTMTQLAEGHTEIAIEHTDRGDEIGILARTLDIFKRNAVERDRAINAQEKETRKKLTKQAHIESLTQEFQDQVSSMLHSVSVSVRHLDEAAESLSSAAERSSQRSKNAAHASGEAANSVQTVASAAEELSSSIQEISQQVSQSSQIANDAVQTAEQTTERVKSLADSAQKIGEVVNLISSIANQTNLLALTATIEAARAGDAGKGFAVVAGEVKALANQTAKATEEISAQVTSVQQETDQAVDAITEINSTIIRINEVSASIAAAVEEQDAATMEISRSVQSTSNSTQQVSDNIAGVSAIAAETGEIASLVYDSSRELVENTETLKSIIETFLAEVKRES